VVDAQVKVQGIQNSPLCQQHLLLGRLNGFLDTSGSRG
jgi:hypothetical protein